MANILQRVNLGQQHPSEIVQYTFDLTENEAFVGSSAETIDSDATWRVVKTTSLSSDLSSTMVNATAWDNSAKTISVELKLGVDGSAYYVAGLLEVASGRRYIVIGKVTFTNKSISVSFA